MNGLDFVRDLAITEGWNAIFQFLVTYFPFLFMYFMLFSTIGYAFKWILSFSKGR